MRVRILSAFLALACATFAAKGVHAAPKKPGKAAKAVPENAENPQLSLEEIAVMLASANGDEVRMAIEGAAGLGSPDIIPMLGERIKAGLPPDLLDAAMDTLVLLGDASAGEVFAALTHHRRESVRLRAVQALVSLRAKDAAGVLEASLGDLAPSVREAAAEGLGELDAKGSVPTLYTAFDRGVDSAARALGRLSDQDQVQRLLGYLGRVPLTSLTPMFDALFARRDLGEGSKLAIVNALAELGTAEARGYLEGLSPKLAADTPSRVRKAIDDAVVRIAQ